MLPHTRSQPTSPTSTLWQTLRVSSHANYGRMRYQLSTTEGHRSDDTQETDDQRPVKQTNLKRIAVQGALHQLRRTYSYRQWGLGYRFDGSDDQLLNGEGWADQEYRLLIPPADRSWADPFPVVSNGRVLIFLEELPLATRRGHISVIEFRDGVWSDPTPVLRRQYHMSYPLVFEWDHAWYMMPETSQNRSLEVYRAVDFPLAWEPYARLMSNIDIVDATIQQIGEDWWLFATVGVHGAPAWDSLYLFHGASPLGPWTEHPQNPVKVDVRSSRPAGRLFVREGVWHRPAQDCTVRYGYALAFNRIDRIDRRVFQETTVSRWEPDPNQGMIAHHTVNAIDGMSVIDFQTRRRRIDRSGRFVPRSARPVVGSDVV